MSQVVIAVGVFLFLAGFVGLTSSSANAGQTAYPMLIGGIALFIGGIFARVSAGEVPEMRPGKLALVLVLLAIPACVAIFKA